MGKNSEKSDFLVVGGGIAGVSCVEQLNLLCPDKKVTLITAMDLVKAVVNLTQYGRHFEEFEVEQKDVDTFRQEMKNVKVVKAVVKGFNAKGL